MLRPPRRNEVLDPCSDYLDHAYCSISCANKFIGFSESVSIPKNPRTDRPVGYAFVDLSTPSEAERAIAELSGKEILERKVSVQLARTPQPAGEKTESAAEGDAGRDGARGSGRGRGRGRGRAARGGRGTRAVCYPEPSEDGCSWACSVRD